MENLLRKSIRKTEGVATDFMRYLHHRINWQDRLIVIKGARGAGKTTILLQHIREHFGSSSHALYASMDDIWFADNRLVDLAEDFFNQGGQYLFLDEIHKYPDWSREIKNIYDDFPGLHLILTGSSSLEISRQQYDLSRRAVTYELREMSLREYIALKYGISLPVVTFDNILHDHVNLSLDLVKTIKPVKFLKEYYVAGQYPFFIENPDNYHQRLLSTLNTILESDLPAILNVDYSSVLKLKKLLYVIASSVPFKPNIAELSARTGIARDTLLRYLNHLEEAHLITLLKNSKKGNSILTKPEKIYLRNSNLMVAISEDTANTGTVRETFFLNQLSSAGKVHYTENGDFMFMEKYFFEVGGKNKSSKQLRDPENAYVAADDIETGVGNKIPLWLFGFLY